MVEGRTPPPSTARFAERRERARTVERAILLYRIDPARHAAARTLARIIQEGRHLSAVVAWAPARNPERRFPRVVVGDAPPLVQILLGPDVGDRVWTLGLGGESSSRPNGYELGQLLSWTALLAVVPSFEISTSAPPVDWVMAVVHEWALDGWTTDLDVLDSAASSLEAQAELVPGEEAEEVLRIAAAIASNDVVSLSDALISYGRFLEVVGRLRVSAQLHTLAYESAIHLVDSRLGSLAARLAGRSSRMAGRWRDALKWYDQAAALAVFDEDLAGAAHANVGLANVHLDRGATPRAREYSTAALGMALAAESGDVLGDARLLAARIARLSGDLAAAASHSWRAIMAFDDDASRARGFIQLGSVLLDSGHARQADDAYSIGVRSLEVGSSTWVLAMDALAYVAAVQGDRTAYERRYAEIEPLVDTADPRDRVQLHFYRAKALSALGEVEDARSAHEVSISYAREHGFLQFSERSELEVEALPDPAISDEHTPLIAEWLADLVVESR